MIRQAINFDAKRIYEIETSCFPKAEAAELIAIAERIRDYPEVCFVLEEEGEILGFVNGATSDLETIEDDFFEHMKPGQGQNVLIFSLAVDPNHQRKGHAKALLEHLIQYSFDNGKQKLILTCKAHKRAYYSKVGFVDMGLADSEHGGAAWYTMAIDKKDH